MEEQGISVYPPGQLDDRGVYGTKWSLPLQARYQTPLWHSVVARQRHLSRIVQTYCWYGYYMNKSLVLPKPVKVAHQ